MVGTGEIAPEDKVVAIPVSAEEHQRNLFQEPRIYNPVEDGRVIDFINFEIQNSGYGDKLAAGIVITGGGAMLEASFPADEIQDSHGCGRVSNEHLTGLAGMNQSAYVCQV